MKAPLAMKQGLLGSLLFLTMTIPINAQTGLPASRVSPKDTSFEFNVRGQGATGDGKTLDTRAINQTIAACARAGGGQVYFPPGRYLSGSIRLRSHVHLYFDAGAVLLGSTNLAVYQQVTPPAYMPEAKWGKWHRGLIIAQGVHDVRLAGPGLIDGNRVFDPTGEEHMRGPHTILFVNSHDFEICDLRIVDAANYAILFEASDDVAIRNVQITGGWDGVHFRGAPGHPCRNVRIVDCEFHTGDDAIAGRYWDHTVISGCVVNSSCNGLRLIGPAQHLLVHACLFYGPGLRPHRTSGRTNMLSGIILQPGAWDPTRGSLDDVLITDVTMNDVASPITLWTKPGNTVGRVTISGLNATGVYRAPFSVEGWGDQPIDRVVLRDAFIEYAGGGTAQEARQTVKGPGVDARTLPAWGCYARNVHHLTIEDAHFSLQRADLRPAVLAERVGRLTLNEVRFDRVKGVSDPVVTRDVDELVWRPGRRSPSKASKHSGAE